MKLKLKVSRDEARAATPDKSLKFTLRVPDGTTAASESAPPAPSFASATPESADVVFDRCKQLLGEVLRVRVNKRRLHEPFLILPTATELPGYFSVIDDPISIKQIGDKINGYAYKVRRRRRRRRKRR